MSDKTDHDHAREIAGDIDYGRFMGTVLSIAYDGIQCGRALERSKADAEMMSVLQRATEREDRLLAARDEEIARLKAEVATLRESVQRRTTRIK